jgi:ubiquinone/menaquinone biosynthesis C-methylase UbiE
MSTANHTWIEDYRQRALQSDPELINGTSSALTDIIVPSILDRFIISPDDVILDVGCGNGRLLSNIRFASRRIGILPSEEEIAVAKRQTSGTNIEILQGTTSSIPLSDGVVDKLVCNSVFLLLADDAEVFLSLREFHRVCKPGASVFIGDMLGPKFRWVRFKRRAFHSIRNVYYVLRGAKPVPLSSGWTAPLYVASKNHFSKLCEKAGFRVRSIDDRRIWFKGKWNAPERYNVMLAAD